MHDSECVCICQGLDISVSSQGLSACSGKSCSRIFPLNPGCGAFLSHQVAQRNPVVWSRKCLITSAPQAAAAQQGLRRFCCKWMGSALGILWHSILESSLASAAEATGTQGPRPWVRFVLDVWDLGGSWPAWCENGITEHSGCRAYFGQSSLHAAGLSDCCALAERWQKA